ncbi:coiled-coil domain-containing protein 116 [Callithrix jacchus]|uniref:Coiled-coil domain containing 116 n=1 Tax=Callithrix jacchus TaxID=9483 RepID=F7IM36_CALJA|nr:coiled-coil domain-containing protein 116 [Callithrix jacchus]XP_035123036.1 coiled-coil domain-containing protein 116 [Callithrix jacchus]
MVRCRHHSGYMADDEARHSMYSAQVQPPKKPLVPETGPASKLGHVLHPPSTCGSPALQGQCRNKRHPQPFGHFLDFLTENQVLDSLETVVEEATERMAAMKTETGVPLVEVQDPVEVPSGRRRARARPSLSTVQRHRAQPSLCTGHPNNYPFSSSSMSDSHSSLMAGWLGPYDRDSDLGAQGLGSLPPVRDKLLLEKNLKRLLQLERKGKGLGQSCSQRDSLLWDSLGSQTSCQWTQEQSPSWFTGLLDSSSGMPEASELRHGERERIFHKQEFNKELKSLLSQLESLDLPGYCPLREPHRTLNFLAEHRLFPALQSVVSRATDKLRGACCCDGHPLFPTSLEPTSELPGQGNLQPPGSEPANPSNTGQPHASPHPTASSPKLRHRKHKDRGGYPSMSSAQVATRFKLKMTPMEKPSVPSSSLHSRKESPSSSRFTKKKLLPSISSKSSMSHFSNCSYEELVDFLTQQAASLIIRKYEFEKDLNKQLGFFSFPVTQVLRDLSLGLKKVKGSHNHQSSEIHLSCLLRKLEEAKRAQQDFLLSTFHRSPETPSVLQELATHTVQDQTTEPCHSLYTDLPASQQLSPLEPRLSVSAHTGMGSSPPRSKDMDSEGHDKVELEDENEDEDEEQDEDRDESGVQSLPEPGEEASVSHPVDLGHSDPS